MARKKDFYEVLGVKRESSVDDIRKAYKKLARKYHPDLNPNDKSAESKFKEISEAYMVLSNPDARKKYDTFGHQGPGSSGFDFSGFDFNNMSGDFRAGGETFFSSFGDIFSDLFGQRARGRGRAAGNPFGFGGARPAPDLRFRMQIGFELAARGGITQIQVPRGGRMETIAVRIPAGVDNGQTIRLKGQGESTYPGSAAGDLLIEIEITPHHVFQREGLDLKCAVPITIAEAVLGAKIEVPTLEGSATISIAPGTQGGQTLRLKGRGIKRNSQKGDLFVIIQIAVPKKINEKSRSLIQAFDQENPLQPRQLSGTHGD